MKRKHKASNYDKERWIQRKIDQKHEARANNPVMQAKIDAQAYVLLRERVAIFGAEWHENCAVRIPKELQAMIDKHGTDFLLLSLDEEFMKQLDRAAG